MKLLIYEYYASGAREDEGLKKAGFAMLDGVLKDFTQLSGIKISTVFDFSLRDLVLKAPYIDKLDICWSEKGEENGNKRFVEVLIKCDVVLIIAPEINGIIAELTAIAEKSGKMVLGSCAQALNLVCNKADTMSLLERRGLPVPRSETLGKSWTVERKAKILEEFSLPLVIKPVYGTGGVGVKLVRTNNQLENLLKQIEASDEELYLVQEFIFGLDASVSCLVLDGKILPLSLNQQIINKEEELIFQGITVPLAHPESQDIFGIVAKACELVKGLKGFVGVDLILSASGPVILEINSRITSAYVALREAVPGNLAEDLWLLCREHRFPDQPKLKETFTYMV
ncbi:MAG: ATP-grasp domain-containing protein [Dehalobacterium sp.]